MHASGWGGDEPAALSRVSAASFQDRCHRPIKASLPSRMGGNIAGNDFLMNDPWKYTLSFSSGFNEIN